MRTAKVCLSSWAPMLTAFTKDIKIKIKGFIM